ncbi:MAG: AAA family ATPase [Planctomycetaceae bacterium]|nr:AAA family ATPase [Planctomycetaceae bacterium]
MYSGIASVVLRLSILPHRAKRSPAFSGLGGLESLKAFCLRALRRTVVSSAVRARGILLLGIPGTGTSAFAKALGQESGRPTLILDVGALMGSLVGQTEERTRQALRTVDAMAPAILVIDEVERALGAASGSNDSGVSTRLLGTLLTWLNDHESDVFVVCTANDVSRLPPEFPSAAATPSTTRAIAKALRMCATSGEILDDLAVLETELAGRLPPLCADRSRPSLAGNGFPCSTSPLADSGIPSAAGARLALFSPRGADVR